MNKIKFTFWIILLVIVVALVVFFKYNPLYASLETVLSFVIGLGCGWGLDKIYNKWIK